VEKKSGGSADKDEFELFLAHLTAKHQIKDLDAYRDGRSKIKSAEQKKEKTAPNAETVKEAAPQPKPEVKLQPKPESKPAQPAQNGERKAAPQQNGQRPGDRRDNRDQRPNRDGDRRNSFNKYSAAPQENPFAKKLDNMNRQAQGLRNPNSQWQKPDAKKPAQPVQKPAVPAAQTAPKAEVAKNTVLPAQKAQLEKQQKIEVQKPASPVQQPKKKEEKKAQKQQFKTITPTVDRSNVKGGVNVGVEYVNEAAPKTRVVDTRTSDVNLSKYDDRYTITTILFLTAAIPRRRSRS